MAQKQLFFSRKRGVDVVLFWRWWIVV